MAWFGVRCVFQHEAQGAYEERVTVWEAESFEGAIAVAEAEADEYARDTGCAYLKLAQAYRLDAAPLHGSEVFSLLRNSDLGPHPHVTMFFDTGREIT